MKEIIITLDNHQRLTVLGGGLSASEMTGLLHQATIFVETQWRLQIISQLETTKKSKKKDSPDAPNKGKKR